jgi:hypothetical protein
MKKTSFTKDGWCGTKVAGQRDRQIAEISLIRLSQNSVLIDAAPNYYQLPKRMISQTELQSTDPSQ